MSALGTVALVAALSFSRSAVGEEILPLDEVVEGQRGYGLSVFKGDQPERFEVEVLGVLHNVQAGLSLILVRLSGQGLERSGVIAGMSGSPVFVDGRLMGAVAYSWAYSHDAVGAVTPIEAMRELPSTGRGGGVDAVASAVVSLRDLVARKRDPELLERSLSILAGEPLGDASRGLGWSVAGFGGRTRQVLSGVLGALSPSGTSAEALAGRSDAAPLEGGDAVAAVMMDGDLRLAATGTVTERRGDELVAFGHPFLGLGKVELPMARAEIVTVLSNQMSSFKLSNVGATVGAVVRDGRAGIVGQLGHAAPILPMRVRITGDSLPPIELFLKIARLPSLTPVLSAVGLLGAADAGGLSGNIGLDLDATFRLGRHGELRVRQSFDGAGAPLQAALHLLAYHGFLWLNSLEEVEVESLDVDLHATPEPRTARLAGGYADRSRVRPGESVRLHLELVPYRGEPQRREVSLRLPVDLPSGRYSLLVGDGATMDAVRLMIEPAEPVRFAQALRLLRGYHSRRELVVLGVLAGRGLTVAGEALPRLPGTVQSIWSAAAPHNSSEVRLAIVQAHSEELSVPLDGVIRIDLDVVRKEPLSGELTEAARGTGGIPEPSMTVADPSVHPATQEESP